MRSARPEILNPSCHQIDGLSNKDNPIFESIKNAPPVVVETYDPYF